MKLKVFEASGKEVGEVNVPAGALDVTPRRDVMHAVVVWQLNERRRYTAHTKNRGEASGGGRKPWKQKGTGRARAGSNTSPVWVGGGVAHGPRYRQPGYEVNKKVRRLALRMALADRAGNEALKVVRAAQFDTPSTKQAASVVAALGGKKTLVVVGDGRRAKGMPSASERSYRNLERVRVLQAEGLNVYDILGADVVLVAEEAVPAVLRRLGVTAEA